MSNIRVCFSYRHIDLPWGGANNFIRALRAELAKYDDITIVDNIDGEYDILFMNQLSLGPAVGSKKMRYIDVLQTLKTKVGKRKRQLVVRAINLKRHSSGYCHRSIFKFWLQDRETIKLLNRADLIIYQSEYQKRFFELFGCRNEHSCIIHNGADARFEAVNGDSVPFDGILRLVAVTASTRSTKRHDLIARFSEYDGVEVVHVGRWPNSLNHRKVKLMGVVEHEHMMQIFNRHHYLLHPAIKDPCPNVLFEAICLGLPVIYNVNVGSSCEIVGANGLAINESDLSETVACAISQYSYLKKRVVPCRPYYSIRRAASEYHSAFRAIYGM